MAIEEFRKKMEAAGLGTTAIRCFERSYSLLEKQDPGMIPETEIEPVADLPNFDSLPAAPAPDAARPLLESCAYLKLNGGLGTGMGLEKAKSLLEVRDGLTFLDLTLRQVRYFRNATGANVRFLLMNSFSTSADTRAFLAQHPDIGDPDRIELVQNKIPKVDAATLTPAVWPQNPDHEWCPPGHGDLYPVLAEKIDSLIADGIQYLFVSNSDNLGATLDPRILQWFAYSNHSFLMEVTNRTPSDRKGGHLARRHGTLILRESAQCPDADSDAFQDIERHRFFNTNNLWIRVDRLKAALDQSGGFLPLPVIQNRKTIDPRDKQSPAVIQLETAMGAAVECFPDAAALAVPRTRFAPVKTTSDLFTLRSDAYQILESGEVRLVDGCNGVPPKVDWDDSYKLVDALDAATQEGVPSLARCHTLKIRGPVTLSSNIRFEGDISISNVSNHRKTVPPGTYTNQHLDLSN